MTDIPDQSELPSEVTDKLEKLARLQEQILEICSIGEAHGICVYWIKQEQDEIIAGLEEQGFQGQVYMRYIQGTHPTQVEYFIGPKYTGPYGLE